MKAIETRYKDRRFRSRTEARWAVFFDSLGIYWKYEEEGFQLRVDPSKPLEHEQEFLYYLPDFWLPDLDLWVEIKGKEADEVEDAKARALAKESGFPVLLLAGSPENPKYRHPSAPRHWLYRYYSDGLLKVDKNVSLHRVLGFKPKSPEWLAAFGEAMGARFEHGESPRARRLS